MSSRPAEMSAIQLIEYLTTVNRSPVKSKLEAIKKRSEQLSADAYRLQRLIIGLEDAE